MSGTFSIAHKRIHMDLKIIKEESNKDFHVFYYIPNEDNLTNIHFVTVAKDITMKGELFSEYWFHLRVIFPIEYPFKAPRLEADVPNGILSGHICVTEFSDLHQASVNPTWTLFNLFRSIMSMQDMDCPSYGWSKFNADSVKETQKNFLEELKKKVVPIEKFEGYNTFLSEETPPFTPKTCEKAEYIFGGDDSDE